MRPVSYVEGLATTNYYPNGFVEMDFIPELAHRLYERRDQAIVVPCGDCSSADFQPVEQDCHGNVEVWCKAHPGHKPVRGWLVFERYSRPGFCRFIAHSVVEDEQGQLFDPTPTRASRRHPFVRDESVEEEFLLMLAARQLVHLDHCP